MKATSVGTNSTVVEWWKKGDAIKTTLPVLFMLKLLLDHKEESFSFGNNSLSMHAITIQKKIITFLESDVSLNIK